MQEGDDRNLKKAKTRDLDKQNSRGMVVKNNEVPF